MWSSVKAVLSWSTNSPLFGKDKIVLYTHQPETSKLKMDSLKLINRNQTIALLLLLTLTVFQLVRVIVFVNVDGGLEHDGGWLLGVSRSLAERGTFTTMVSTIVDPTVSGGMASLTFRMRTAASGFTPPTAWGRWFLG